MLSSSLEDVGPLGRSRAATRASLPEPTGGRFVRTTDPTEAPDRLRRLSSHLRRQSEERRAEVSLELRAMAAGRRRSYRPASTEGYGAMRTGRHGAGSKGRHLSSGSTGAKGAGGADEGRYAFNAGNENSGVHYRSKAEGGGRKSLADYEHDILGELDQQVERLGVDSLTPAERRIHDAMQESDALRMQAEEIATVLRAREGGAFGELDPAAAASRVEEMAAGLPAQRVNMRARRERGAARHGTQETPRVARNAGPEGPTKGTTKAARARFRRYFNGTGPLSEAIDAIKLGAEQEVKAAQRIAQRQVSKARKRLTKAREGGDQEALSFARKMLVDAQRTERTVSAELARAKAVYGANPREIAARVRELLSEQSKLTKMERQARKVAEHNAQLADRPGLATSSYEEYRAVLEEGWQAHTSKYHKGTLLPPETHEAVRKVDAEIARLLVKDGDVQAFTRFFNQAGSAWKSLQLSTPRFHARNLVDDGLADWLAGARNPLSYLQSARILRGTFEGTLRTKAGTFTAEQIVAMAESQGALHMGYAAWEVGKQQERGMRVGRLGVHAPGSGRWSRGSRWLGEVREDWSRLGLFIEMLKKGEDPVRAGLTVRRFRYDYSDLAPFLMQARAVALPFLTFTWKTIPMLAKQFAERPGTFSHINMVQEYLNELGGDPDRSLLAPWEADAFGVPAPDEVKGVFGAEEGEPVLFNPARTFRYGTLEVFNPRLDAITRNWLGMVGPIKVPIEALTGYSTFQARALRPGERARAPAFIEWLHEAGIPVAGYGPKRDAYTGASVPGYSARLNNLLATFPPFQQLGAITPGGGNTDWRRDLARFTTGLDLRPEERARATFYAERYGGR